jgi:hypothetical protein
MPVYGLVRDVQAPAGESIYERPGLLPGKTSDRRLIRGVDLYIGDGASITRSLLRRANGALIGHASIQVQLGWCEEVGVSRAIFTHCGTQIVRGRSRAVNAAVRQLGCGHGIDARIACDGDRLSLPPVIDQTPCGYETCQS